MTHFSRQWIIVPALMLGVCLSSALSTYSQTANEEARNSLIESIKIDARRHVDNDSPLQTQLIVDTYKNNGALTAQEIMQTYEGEYARLKNEKKPGLWEQLKPNIGWLAAGILLILLLLRDAIKEWLGKFIEAIGDGIYNRLAGNRLLRRVALRRYRQSLIEKYEKLHIPFRPNLPLEMREVYVPLKVAGSNDSDQIEAYCAVAEYRRIMIKGAPGSGKSMLLKNVVFNHAEGRFNLPDQPVPILLELHRLSDPALSIEQQLVEALARNGFPRGERFVAHNLEQGKLMLLLDGLDEVNSNERARVAQQVKDFLDRHRACRALITCRTAVYKGEFNDVVDQTLEIVEFNDQQIRRFLNSWSPFMPADKSIEQLMQTMRDRPLIMSLARNPLLLTIIAYLYTDTPYVLPHSRSEFYDQATDVLLRQWHGEHNKFDFRNKRRVLQHLALHNQDSGQQRGQDRQTMDYETVLEVTRQLLPRLNLRPDQDAVPLLDEIVERSGLLLSIDGGEAYQFAHLTLQEFFAAAELTDDKKRLIHRFVYDPDAWRETVKLWCGLVNDSTDLIRKVYETDPITAFECLADAQQVDEELTDEIIGAFKLRLGEAGADGVTSRAFGAVASDMRPRGDVVFNFLKEQLDAGAKPERRMAAAHALSLTNLPRAARELARHYFDLPEVRVPLVRMGDLAVPELIALARKGSIIALDDLQMIGTPQAAQGMAPLLWDYARGPLAHAAAWRLAALLSAPGVEEALRDFKLSDEQIKAQRLDWIWQPFDEPPGSSLPIIAGRIAHLMLISQEFPEPLPLDPRLVIPLCAIEIRNEVDVRDLAVGRIAELQKFSRAKSLLSEVESKRKAAAPRDKVFSIHSNLSAIYPGASNYAEAVQTLQTVELDEAKEIVNNLLEQTKPSARWRYLFNCLPLNLQIDLLERLGRGRRATRNDWSNVFRRIEYTFDTGWHFRAVVLVAGLLSLIAMIEIFASLFLTPVQGWQKAAAIFAGVSIPSSWFFFLSKDDIISRNSNDFHLFLVFGLLAAPIAIYMIIADRLTGKSGIWGTKETLVFLPAAGTSPGTAYFATRAALKFLSMTYVVGLWVVLLAALVALWQLGRRRERSAANPLYSILAPRRSEASQILPLRKRWLFF